MGTYQELLKRIDEKNYITEREHKEYLKELNELLEHIEKLEYGKTIIYAGKIIAMNRVKYYEYCEKQLNSPHAMAFLQDQMNQLSNFLGIDFFEENDEHYMQYIDLENNNTIIKKLTKKEYERLRGIKHD